MNSGLGVLTPGNGLLTGNIIFFGLVPDGSITDGF
jgi:hypothetical protein